MTEENDIVTFNIVVLNSFNIFYLEIKYLKLFNVYKIEMIKHVLSFRVYQ